MKEIKKEKITVARLWPRYEGQASSRISVISGIDRQRYETKIVYLMKNSNNPNRFEQMGYKTFYLCRKRYFRVFNLSIIWKLVKVFKQEKIDILHSHGHLATVYGTIAAKLAGVPVVLTHVPGLNRSKRFRRKVTNWVVFKWISKILTTGEAVRKDVLQTNFALPSHKVTSLGNSIDFEQFAIVQVSNEQIKERFGLKLDSFVFGTIGRLVPTKGYSYLIKAFTEVKQAVSSSELIFIGDGRLRGELDQQAKNTPCRNSIHFLGRRNNIPELLKGFDTFVLPSVAEGIPRSLLEAMASGLPCIATSVGGIPEIISDGEFGSLVPPANPQELAKAMIALASMTNLERNELAERAKQRVETNYCNEKVIIRLQNIYQNEMIAKRGFGKYLKDEIDLIEVGQESIVVDQLHVQYNPERFDQYKSLHEGPSETVLDINDSPHCRMLADYEANKEKFLANTANNDYYRMQRLFGKSHKSAISKVDRLVKLYERIKKNGFTSKIVVTTKPVIANEYNRGYEIYTGHHRVACCINLGIKQVPSIIMEARPKTVISTEI